MAKNKQQTFSENNAQVTSKPSDQNPDARAQDGGASAGTLGQRLRRAREQRRVSLREISDHTRISMRHLEAIEADNYKELPGGIFNRSFIRAYAKQVGYDEKEALDLYARIAREHGESDEVATSPTRSRVYMDGESTRSPMVTALLSLVILGVLILVVYAGLHWYRRNEAGAQATDSPAPSATAAPAQQQPPPAPPAPADGLQVQVRAKGEDVWLRTTVDDERASDGTMKADETREFKPQNRVSLSYSKSKQGAVEVTINGQVAQAPAPNPKSGLVEWDITKDGYKQFLP
ncbi:MAG TPA: helix-turn-helix domain-containing protein [Pyrinomonadaceae bacterium]|nr:helix-turn-helix domain-containing protein [Pyrinomonadaceae bacterium]